MEFIEFQSLLLWIDVEDDTLKTKDGKTVEFQSLLLWIDVEDENGRDQLPFWSLFQSLLLWIDVEDCSGAVSRFELWTSAFISKP